MEDIAKIISKVPLVTALQSGLHESVVDAICDIGEEGTLAAGDTLYEKGEDGDNTGMVLLSGSVEVSHNDSKRKIVHAPELFG